MREVRKGAGGEAGTIQASGDLTYAGALLCVLGARDAALTSKRKQGPRNHLGSILDTMSGVSCTARGDQEGFVGCCTPSTPNPGGHAGGG